MLTRIALNRIIKKNMSPAKLYISDILIIPVTNKSAKIDTIRKIPSTATAKVSPAFSDINVILEFVV